MVSVAVYVWFACFGGVYVVFGLCISLVFACWVDVLIACCLVLLFLCFAVNYCFGFVCVVYLGVFVCGGNWGFG